MHTTMTDLDENFSDESFLKELIVHLFENVLRYHQNIFARSSIVIYVFDLQKC